jgi:cellulase/cellobiase CelA1
MKLREINRGIVKRMQNSESGTSRMRMAVAFIAGMVITVALAQTPVVADIFSSRLTHESVVPTLPDTSDSLKPSGSPDTSNPVKPCMNELVYAMVEEAASPC